MTSLRWRASLLVAAAWLSACHATRSGQRPTRPGPSQGAGVSKYLIEGDELNATPGENLYEVVRKARPVWLERTVRGASGNSAVAVYLDEHLAGSLDLLRQLQVRIARRLQYLSPTEAQLRFGARHGSRAAIVVETVK